MKSRIGALGIALALPLSILAFVLLSVAVRPVQAATITVCASGCDHNNISDAILAAAAGDTIDIQAGTYTENVVIDREVTLQGAGSGTTTVNGGAADVVIRVSPGVTATIDGLQITNGLSADGGGIDNEGALTVTNSIITNNAAVMDDEGKGGGIFNSGGRVTLQNVEISDNTADDSGAGIFNANAVEDGVMILDNVTISGNQIVLDNLAALGTGGGIDNSGLMTVMNSDIDGNTAYFEGGGIENTGTMTVTNTTIQNNQAGSHGAGVENFTGEMTISGSEIRSNTIISNADALPAQFTGGGIYNVATLTLVNTTIADNQVLVSLGLGGGIDNEGDLTMTGGTVSGNKALVGGGIYNRLPLTINGADILNNQAAGSAGIHSIAALELDGVTISGNGVTETMGVGGGVNAQAALTVSNSVISNNAGGVQGGGVNSVDTAVFSDSEITGNTADTGAGIYNEDILELTNVTIADNQITSASGLGGGIYNTGPMTMLNGALSNNQDALRGGGLYNTGTVTMTATTVATNTAEYGGGIANLAGLTVDLSLFNGNMANGAGDSAGAGIYNSSDGAVTVINSTFSDNTAADTGAAVYNQDITSTVMLRSSTLYENANGGASGGTVHSVVTDTVTLSNTLVAGSKLGSSDCAGEAIISAGYNLDSDGSCNLDATSLSNISDPRLGPLQDNGGETETHALLLTSPAIDASPVCETTDQRGMARPVGDACDIGAYETKVSRVFLPMALKP